MARGGRRDLRVWQKSIDLVVDIYCLSKSFPSDEKFSLTQQIRRAAVSIPSNITEGKGRATQGAYQNHLSISLGSLAEVDTQLELACRLEYISEEQLHSIRIKLEEIGRMMSGLRKSLDSNS